MFTVALIGADGSGKTTITRQLLDTLPLPAKYIYMGVNSYSSNLLLPTTRLWLSILRSRGVKPHYGGPRDPRSVKVPPRNFIKRMALGVKSALGLSNQMAEEWFRQIVVWYYQWRGYIVLLDRHLFFDCYAHEIAKNGIKKPIAKRIHGFALEHFYPRPDLVICLDAPAEVLFQRKEEGTLELRESRRQEYLQFRHVVENFMVIDASQSEEVVTHQVADLIRDFYQSKKANSHVLEV